MALSGNAGDNQNCDNQDLSISGLSLASIQGVCSFAGVKAFCVTLILMMGWLCTRGETQPDTPDPLPAPGNFPAQPSAKDLSNIEWLDAEVIHKARQAVVAIQPDGVATSSSNGFFASADGLVVTSASALEGNRRVVVLTLNKEEIKGARLMAIDPMTDLAVLATGRKKQAYLQVHDKPVAAGDSCAVIFHAGEGIFKTADGKLLERREELDWSEARFLEMWSIAQYSSGIRKTPSS
jgi:hypothetical protein